MNKKVATIEELRKMLALKKQQIEQVGNEIDELNFTLSGLEIARDDIKEQIQNIELMKSQFEQKLWDIHHTGVCADYCGCDICSIWEDDKFGELQFKRRRACKNIFGINNFNQLVEYQAQLWATREDATAAAKQ